MVFQVEYASEYQERGMMVANSSRDWSGFERIKEV
jgi:hypothetical protein